MLQSQRVSIHSANDYTVVDVLFTVQRHASTLALPRVQARTDVVKDSSGRSRGYGTVLFDTNDDAEAAMQVRRHQHDPFIFDMAS